MSIGGRARHERPSPHLVVKISAASAIAMPWLLGEKAAAGRVLLPTPHSKDSAMMHAPLAGSPVKPRQPGFSVALAAGLALLIASAAPLYAQDKDPLVAKVNGVDIHQSDLALAEQEAGQLPPMSPDAKQDYMVQISSDLILIAKAAEAKKFADTADFKQKMEFNRRKTLMEGLMASVAKDALTDEAMHKVYDEAIKQAGSEQ